MGNCISIDLSLADLITRCCECTGVQVKYVWQLKDNLEELNSSIRQLEASKSHLLERLGNEEGPQMKRTAIVREWLESVDNKLIELVQLTKEAEQEIDERLCLGGCCSKNCKSSYLVGVDVADAKVQVDNLNQRGAFQGAVVERVSVEPKYLHNLKSDLEALEASTKGLKGLKEDVLRRVKREEGPVIKVKQEVEAWFSNVDSLINDVNVLVRDGPQEIEKWSVGDFSNDGFGERVAEKLELVKSLKQEGANFEAVVDRVPAKPEYISQLEDDLDALQSARDELWGLKVDIMSRVTIDEVQPKKRRTQKVHVWLSGVEATITEVDALLKDGPQEIKKMRLGDFSDFGETVAKKLKKVIDLQGKGIFQEVSENAPPEAVIKMDCVQPVGFEAKLKELWSWIIKKEVGIVGLYGMGGVGKTTLLVHINNQFLNTPNDFDYVIWVVVSKDLKLSKVQEEIGERIGISSDEWKKKNIDEKSKDISRVLLEKKFVLLLDDLWEKVDLAKAGVPIPNRKNGSKIVFTTRSEIVCSLMYPQKRIKVETLPHEEAWKLFKEKVGEEVLGLHSDIRGIAEKVAKECAGLPLALITIARAMTLNKTPEAWETALKQLQQSTVSDSEGMMDDIFPLLKFSYDKLPDDRIRSCFIYCALFPEDFKIHKDDLMDYWIFEKFEDDKNNENLSKEKARDIIRMLVHACLLEEEGKYVKLHDVLRDMAIWIACKLEKSSYNFFVKAGMQLKTPEVREWPVGVKRTSLMENSITNVKEVPACPDLLTLFLCRNPRLRQINGTFFQSMHELTVLDLSNSRVQELPLEIAELGSLQYLNLSLSLIEQLPPELKKLKKLKYLNLEHNYFLGMIPMEVISSFSCLQVLRMFRCGFFYDGAGDNILADSIVHIEELQLLKHLNSLSITIRTADALQLYFSTENLPSCTQALSLECFGGSKSLDLSPLENMEHLEILQISATQDLEEIGVESRILREQICFKHLREVSVEYCARVSNLRWLILAPTLAVLKVAVCERMEEIISFAESEEVHYSEKLTTFARLEVLVLEDLPQLKSICCSPLSAPVLKRIRVADCPMLKKLPLKSASESKGHKKVVIEAEENWWKNVEWEDEATKAAIQSSFRSFFPRTRICRPTHDYFYEIWKSVSS